MKKKVSAGTHSNVFKLKARKTRGGKHNERIYISVSREGLLRIPRAKAKIHGEVDRLDQGVAADHIFGFGVRTVVDDLLFAVNYFTAALQGMPGVLDIPRRAKLLEPSDPLLRVFLPLLGGCGVIPPAKQICKFAHCVFLLVFS